MNYICRSVACGKKKDILRLSVDVGEMFFSVNVIYFIVFRENVKNISALQKWREAVLM